MAQVTKVLSDFTTLTPTAAQFVRPRTIVLSGKRLKPFTTMNVFFSSVNANSYYTPCSKVVITTSSTFGGYDTGSKQTSDITDRTTSVNSYDILDKGDVISCVTGTAVVVSDETIYNRDTLANERVLYVTNIKGTLSGAIANRQNTATGTVVSVASGTFETNSLGNLYGILTIPANTFKGGANKIALSDSENSTSGSATTFAEDGYVTTGIVNVYDRFLSTQTFEETVVVNTIVTTVTQTSANDWGDPLAQTFQVPIQFTDGVCLTSVDLYFAAGSSSDPNPVEVQIVETLNGYPTTKPLQFARCVKPATQINFNATGLTPTKFTFESLVELEPGGEYAIKILSNSTKYKVWTSYIGDTELTNPAKIISTQPYLGSLFKSQNNSTWTAEQLQDLTFKLNYAKFNTGVIGKVKLVENITADYQTLPPNPFKITNTQTKVKVFHPCHGMAATQQITYSGSTVGAFNATYSVTTVVDSDHYIITAAAQAADDLVGGDAVKAQKTIKYDSIMIDGLDDGKAFGTKVTMRLAGATSLDSTDTVIDTSKKNDLLVNKYVHTSTNRTGLLSGVSSLQLKIDLSSVNPAKSPIINLDNLRVNLFGSKVNIPSVSQVDYDIDGETVVVGSSDVSFTATTNLIDVPVTTDYTKIKLGAWIKIVDSGGSNDGKTGYISVIDTTNNQLTLVGDALVTQASRSANIIQYLSYVDEIANEGTAESKYITQRVNLAEQCTGFRVIFVANIPTDADVDMYYRTSIASSTDLLENKAWSKNTITYKKSATEEEFTEFEYDITDLAKFDTFQFKFVFKSTNTAATPKLRKLRIIAHA